MIFLDCGNKIITVGYTCIMHNSNKQYNVEISRIKEKRIIQTNDVATIGLEILDQVEVDFKLYKNIIIRDGEKTVGIGLLM